MDLEQLRARLLEISAKLEGFDENMSDEEEQEFDSLTAEYEEISSKVSRAEKVAAMKAKTAQPAGRKTAPAAPAASQRQIQVIRDEKERFGGFRSSAEFLNAVKEYGSTGRRAEEFNNVMYEKNGEDGGFLVPEELNTEIQRRLGQAQESLWARANTTPVSGNAMSMMVDESQPWNSGVVAYWIAEGKPYTESKPALKPAHFRLHKLGAMVKVTDELLEDAVALEAFVKRAAGEAIMHKVNETMLTGDGAGKPMGLLNSPFAITVAKEAGQAADSITAENIIKMSARLFPAARQGAVWLVHPSVLEQLALLKSGDNYLFLQAGTQLNQGPFSTLMGLPVMPMMEGLPALGDTGDIALVNFSYYYGIFKAGGVKQSMSTHLHFDRDITAFKWTFRLDGRVPFTAPVTTQYGDYQMSAVVKLADRA